MDTPPMNSKMPSPPSKSPSLEDLEGPLLTMSLPMNDKTSPSKPLIEMSDKELEEWSARVRDCRLQHSTMLAHLKAEGATRARKPSDRKPKEPEIDFLGGASEEQSFL